MPTGGNDRARPGPATMGPARCRAGLLRSPRPAGTRVRVRPAPHLVTTTVDARTCATPGLLAPAPALASVPARNQHDKPAEHPFAAAYRRFTRTTDPTRIRLARLKSLSVMANSVRGGSAANRQVFRHGPDGVVGRSFDRSWPGSAWAGRRHVTRSWPAASFRNTDRCRPYTVCRPASNLPAIAR